MTRIYLASPSNPLQASVLTDMPVLLSFGAWREPISSFAQAFGPLLLDSGAWSAFNVGMKIDPVEYFEWVSRFKDVDAVAGLDDIGGDWRKSLSNYKYGGFPTMHNSDPPDLLGELIDISRERGNWLGIGLVPPRTGKGDFLTRTLERIPDDIHVHGFALRAYRKTHKFGSIDSTNWWRDSMMYRTKMPWLTPAECLDIVIKRERREVIEERNRTDQLSLFANTKGSSNVLEKEEANMHADLLGDR